MNNFKRLAWDLPTGPLLAIVDAHPEWWKEQTLRQSYPGTAHHDTESIILNGTKEKDDLEKIFNDQTTETYPHFEECRDALYPILGRLLDECPKVESFGRIIIARLPAGKSVDPHIDEGKYAESSLRLHAVLRTNPHCYLAAGDEKVHFGAGELWWFNHRIWHSAHNFGETERIHLIIDVRGTV